MSDQLRVSDQHLETVVRRARQTDLEGLVACSNALFAEDADTRDPSIHVGRPRDFGPARFAAAMDDPSRLLLVADRGEQVVGHLMGTLTERRPAWAAFPGRRRLTAPGCEWLITHTRNAIPRRPPWRVSDQSLTLGHSAHST